MFRCALKTCEHKAKATAKDNQLPKAKANN